MKRSASRRARRSRHSRRSSGRYRAPSSTLLIGAAAGLLGLAFGTGGCAEDGPRLSHPVPEETPDTTTGEPGANAEATYNITVSTTPVTYEEFLEACKARGGFVQTTAACAGNNACKGFSYLEPTLTEHSCKGLNNCGPGMSCVVLQEDSGLSGKEIYEGTEACAAFCHAQFEPVYDPSIFTLHVRPGTLTEQEALERFLTGPVERLRSRVAFGATGLNDDGVAYANMPPHYKKYSRAEIERVVDYIRTLNVKPVKYEIKGPKAGH